MLMLMSHWKRVVSMIRRVEDGKRVVVRRELIVGGEVTVTDRKA